MKRIAVLIIAILVASIAFVAAPPERRDDTFLPAVATATATHQPWYCSGHTYLQVHESNSVGRWAHRKSAIYPNMFDPNLNTVAVQVYFGYWGFGLTYVKTVWNTCTDSQIHY
jgi:hypothetical protein